MSAQRFAATRPPAPQEAGLYRLWFERNPPPDVARLLDGFAVIAGVASDARQTPLAALAGSHAIVAGARIPYDGGLMDSAPTVRVICRTGAGIDNIDIAAATARGIAVCNTPDAPTVSTAEHAIMLMLCVAKRLKRLEAAIADGRFEVFSDHDGVELRGLTLGIVGLGRIGRQVARLGRAFGMDVLAVDPFLPNDGRLRSLRVRLLPTLPALLGEADIVSIHAPLTSDTRHLVDAEALARMKPGSILINAARGGLVNERDLLQALESGHLGGAGLDVFDPEPPEPGNPLLHRADVIATPHVAGVTVQSKERLWRSAITQALEALRGKRPRDLLNPEVWPLKGK